MIHYYKRVKVGSHVEHHYQWDTDKIDKNNCSKIIFCGVEFSYGEIYTTGYEYLGTEKISMNHRYKYYGSPISTEGTLFANLEDNKISDDKFYNHKKISTIVEDAQNNSSGTVGKVFFWIFWIILISMMCYGFCIIDNKWLE